MRRRAQRSSGKQKGIEPLVIQIVRQRPTQFRGRGLFQIPMNGRLSDRATAGDLVLVQPQAKPQAENFLYFSHRQLSLGNQLPPPSSGGDCRPLLSSAASLT